jgi:hypothetical protein
MDAEGCRAAAQPRLWCLVFGVKCDRSLPGAKGNDRFTGWRSAARWAAALLIRSRKDLLERLRDHDVAGAAHSAR